MRIFGITVVLQNFLKTVTKTVILNLINMSRNLLITRMTMYIISLL